MKKVIISSSVLLCLFFAACSKVAGPANGKSIQPNNHLDSLVSMSAIVNGLAWQTDSAFGYNIVYSGNDSTVSNINIIATQNLNGSVSTIQLYISRYSGPNEYAINPPLVSATYYSGNIRHYATAGTIVITSTANYSLIGTFNFAGDSVTATGKFNVATP